jgi:hypothetical protein
MPSCQPVAQMQLCMPVPRSKNMLRSLSSTPLIVYISHIILWIIVRLSVDYSTICDSEHAECVAHPSAGLLQVVLNPFRRLSMLNIDIFDERRSNLWRTSGIKVFLYCRDWFQCFISSNVRRTTMILAYLILIHRISRSGNCLVFTNSWKTDWPACRQWPSCSQLMLGNRTRGSACCTHASFTPHNSETFRR